MYNPCPLLDSTILARILAQGEIYFVRQHYPRGRSTWNEQEKAALLLCPYADKTQAREHLAAIATDPFRHLYNASLEEDLKKLHIAAAQPAGYPCFAAVFYPDYKERISAVEERKIKQYVRHTLHWTVSRNNGLEVTFFFRYGILHAELASGKKRASVIFDDIENGC